MVVNSHHFDVEQDPDPALKRSGSAYKWKEGSGSESATLGTAQDNRKCHALNWRKKKIWVPVQGDALKGQCHDIFYFRFFNLSPVSLIPICAPWQANISANFFRKKFGRTLMLFSGAWGKMIHKKKPEAKKNLVTLSLFKLRASFMRQCKWPFLGMRPTRAWESWTVRRWCWGRDCSLRTRSSTIRFLK